MCSKDSFNRSPTTEKIWKATKHKDFTRKTRDFIWKGTQNAYKIGEYWFPIAGFQERGTCPICDVQEDMDHILTKCNARPRKLAWELARGLWRRRDNRALPHKLGDILGCGLADFALNDKPNKGKNRLYRIIMSETAYLLWKMRNERRIRDGDTAEQPSDKEITNRWMNAINKRLTVDRSLTDAKRFGKKAVDENLVKSTWFNCLKGEESLPPD